MQSDNKVSSFLLLILIGLGIYLLLNRGEGFKPLAAENFNSVYPTEPFEDVSSQPIVDDDYDDDQLPDSQEYNLPDNQQYMLSDSQEYNLPDSQQYMLSDSQQYNLSDSQQYMPSDSQQYNGSVNNIPMQGTSVFNFEPNDESIFDNLSELIISEDKFELFDYLFKCCPSGVFVLGMTRGSLGTAIFPWIVAD
jgi:hypothetical protein